MPTLVIVGAQWGDEAKGKFVDVFGETADMVVRYSGGNNAGHTVIVEGEVFKFHLVPSGILHPEVHSVVASGTVICPKGILEELDRTRAARPNLGRLSISKAAHVVMPYHRALDRLEEAARGADPLGTTTRGIGPAYQDKAARTGIRMADLVDPDRFAAALENALRTKNRILEVLGGDPFDFESIFGEYREYAERLGPLVADTHPMIQAAVDSGERVLFEGAQGTWLDLDCGTYPYVTSSHPIAAGACLGTGVGPRDIDQVLGVCKAYTTRVGGGPFPTELLDDVGERIRTVGQEFGTTTGRGRRCGWMDLVALKASARLNSFTGLIVTRADVLSGFESVQAAVAYRFRGATIQHLPADPAEFAECEPIYETFPGWSGDIRSARRWEDLPAELRRYLEFMAEVVGVPLAAISVGPDREETLVLRPELVWSSDGPTASGGAG